MGNEGIDNWFVHHHGLFAQPVGQLCYQTGFVLDGVAKVIQGYGILSAEQTNSACNTTVISSVTPAAFLPHNDRVISIRINKMRP